MSRPTVIILGAAGLVGTALRRRLVGHFRLISLDRRPMAAVDDAPAWRGAIEERRCEIDLGEPEAVADWWSANSDWRDDVVALVNLAAYYDFRNSENPEYLRLHRGLKQVIDLVWQDLSEDAVVIQASSLATLAPTEPGRKLRSKSPRDTSWQYAHWKIEADRLLDASGLAQTVVQLVLGAIYSDDGELVPLYEHIERVRRGGLMARLFPGDPSHGLTYVHVDDVCEAVVETIKRFPGRGGRYRFLVGQTSPVAYATIQGRASEMLHARTMPVRRIPRWLAIVGAWLTVCFGRLVRRQPFIRPWMVKIADHHYEIDPEEMRAGLAWEPKRALESDLNILLAQARQDPERWHQINLARPR